MTLIEVNKELEQLENQYNYFLQEKEIILNNVLPQANKVSIKVDGGKREDRMINYIETLESRKIDEKLEYIDKRIKNLMNYIEEELKIIGKYNPLERKIIELREKGVKWEDISQKVHYSKRQCIRIYKKFKKTRRCH